MLGTFVTVTVYAPTRAEGISVISAAFDEFRRVDALMSIHRPDSELSGLNARAATEPVPVSADLFRVIGKAEEISERSEGSFDITIRPPFLQVNLYNLLYGMGIFSVMAFVPYYAETRFDMTPVQTAAT